MIRNSLSLIAVALLTGCSFAPHYDRPQTPSADQWKPVEGWQPADPANGAPRGDWWTAFNDPTLNDLMARADQHNQTVAQAAATWREARATTSEARASLFPTVTADGSVTHSYTGSGRAVVTGGVTSGGNDKNTSTNYTVDLGASWAPDFFGAVRNTISNAKATEQSQLAALADARLVLHADLATAYLGLRGADAQLTSLQATVDAYQRSLTITENQYKAGIAPHSDVYSAQSQLASAQSDLEGEKQTRAQLEDAIAVLVGANAASFSLPAATAWQPVTPDVPVALPSALLQRRPDVAEAERSAAAANAEIGVEKAAFFPSITLSPEAGFTSSALSGLFSASTALWSLGAQAGETLLDFGARTAKVRQARAAYDAEIANYRGVALAALQNVQDELVAQRILAHQEVFLRVASIAADKSEASLLAQYRAGTIVYTNVVTGQATALTARRALITAQTDRQTAVVALVQALGGGWDQANLTNGQEAAQAETIRKAQPEKH